MTKYKNTKVKKTLERQLLAQWQCTKVQKYKSKKVKTKKYKNTKKRKKGKNTKYVKKQKTIAPAFSTWVLVALPLIMCISYSQISHARPTRRRRSSQVLSKPCTVSAQWCSRQTFQIKQVPNTNSWLVYDFSYPARPELYMSSGLSEAMAAAVDRFTE